jgi:hypothetical protein
MEKLSMIVLRTLLCRLILAQKTASPGLMNSISAADVRPHSVSPLSTFPSASCVNIGAASGVRAYDTRRLVAISSGASFESRSER